MIIDIESVHTNEPSISHSLFITIRMVPEICKYGIRRRKKNLFIHHFWRSP